jgi:acyl-CoA reductase-like NAD-dependent aldehyde dehydrogenase
VVLLSAAEAGIYAGAGWFAALVEAARDAVPAARFSAILDCGGDAGAAQAALRASIEAVIFTGRADVAERLAGIAAERGARLLTARPEPTLDLETLFFADAEALRRHCAGALAPRCGG